MKPILILSLLALSGCAYVQQAITANPQAASAGAIAVEARTGIECAGRTQAGDTRVSEKQLRLQYERIGFDMAVSPLLGGSALAGVKEARNLTDNLCPPLPVPPAAPVSEPE